jgi:MoxR-like ATPase
MLRSCWDRITAILAMAPAKREGHLLLHGPSGTGKTRCALTQGLATGEQVIYTVVTEETGAAEIRGHWIQHRDSFKFLKGPCLRAWLGAPARLVLDEADKLSSDALSLMLSILDDPVHARLLLPWGRELRPSPGFLAIATMNGDPRTLPTPFLERFAYIIHVDRPNPEALKLLPSDLRELAKKADPLGDKDRRNSLRTWFRFARLREELGEKTAAFLLFGERADDLLVALAALRHL